MRARAGGRGMWAPGFGSRAVAAGAAPPAPTGKRGPNPPLSSREFQALEELKACH